VSPRVWSFYILTRAGTGETIGSGGLRRAESARGISPRAAHRTVRDSLPSHGSCHSSRAAALRHKPVGSSRYRLTKSIMTRMTRPLRSTGITPLHRYYGAVRPWLAHRYFRPRGANRLRLFPWHRLPGSQVPYESLDQIHAPCTPDIAGSVSRFLPCCSQSWEATLVLMPSMVFRCVLGGSLALVSLIPT
jgi:hypothetical protein